MNRKLETEDTTFSEQEMNHTLHITNGSTRRVLVQVLALAVAAVMVAACAVSADSSASEVAAVQRIVSETYPSMVNAHDAKGYAGMFADDVL